MSEISIRHKKKKHLYIIANKIKYPEVLNAKLLEVINGCVIDDFLPLQAKMKKKKGVIVCRVEKLVPLNDYFKNIVNKDQFLNIVQQIITIIKNCDKYKIVRNNLELHMETVFVEPNTKRIKCIYWPIANNNTYVDAHNFFKGLPSYLNFSIANDAELFRKYSLFLNSLKAFSLNNFEKLVLNMQGKNTQPVGLSPESRILTPNDQYKQQPKKNSDNIAYNPIIIKNKSYQPVKNNIAEQVYLWRLSNNKKYLLSGAVTTIGSSTNCNIVITDNSTISRQHALIEKIDQNYFLTDCGSTNHSYVNGRILKPQQKVKISNQTIIKLANEEFRILVN